jgi:hypothetical protein
MIQIQLPRFNLGRLVATPAALEAIRNEGKTPFVFVARHAVGDWGDDLSEEDRHLNDEAVRDGSRILSAFVLSTSQERLWCITEAEDDNGQREATTLLLSSEY